MRGNEDPYLKIGQVNDRERKAESRKQKAESRKLKAEMEEKETSAEPSAFQLSTFNFQLFFPTPPRGKIQLLPTPSTTRLNP